MGNVFHFYLAGLIFMTNTATGGDHLQQVAGLTNGFLDLSFNETVSQPIIEVLWKVTRGSKIYKIAEFKDNKLVVHDVHYKNRLEISSDGMGLRITNLTRKDSGIYIAKSTLEDNVLHDESFNVTVYEPVPDPNITVHCEKGEGNTYNVTLHCSVPANTPYLSYIWKYRHNGFDYQSYEGTGDTIQMSLPPEAIGVEFMCIVRNPADSKNVTKKCPEEGQVTGSQTRHHRAAVIACSFILVLIIAVMYGTIDNVNISITDTNNTIPLNNDPEEPFNVPEDAVKYSDLEFIEIHPGKEKQSDYSARQNEKMAFED